MSINKNKAKIISWSKNLSFVCPNWLDVGLKSAVEVKLGPNKPKSREYRQKI